jgi:hypothetical protein
MLGFHSKADSDNNMKTGHFGLEPAKSRGAALA